MYQCYHLVLRRKDYDIMMTKLKSRYTKIVFLKRKINKKQKNKKTRQNDFNKRQ